MIRHYRRRRPGSVLWSKIRAAVSGQIVIKTHTYNLLSFIIKYNKTISISVFILFSGFLFVYCTTAPVAIIPDKTEKAGLHADRQPAVEAPAEDAVIGKPDSKPEVLSSALPDLRNIISILNLDYSDETLQGIFWGENDFNSTVYLSFDDGPNMSLIETEDEIKTVTDSILDILRQRNLKAVFFINGMNLEYGSSEEEKELERVVLRMINEGHLIGNHSYSHHNLAKGKYSDGINDEDDIAREFILTQDSLNELLGFAYPLVLVRPPYAEPGRTIDLDKWLISKRKYLISLQYDSYDYAYKENGLWNRDALMERMVSLLSEQEEGGVLLLHELESTVFMLPGLLDNIILERGYKVAGMEGLLIKKYGRKS